MRRNGWKIDLFPIDIEFEMVYNIERVKKYKPYKVRPFLIKLPVEGDSELSQLIDRIAVFATKQVFLQLSHAVQVQHGTTLEKKMLHKFQIQDKQPYFLTGGSLQSHLLRPRGRTFFLRN